LKQSKARTGRDLLLLLDLLDANHSEKLVVVLGH
jgi:hypothetical protein